MEVLLLCGRRRCNTVVIKDLACAIFSNTKLVSTFALLAWLVDAMATKRRWNQVYTKPRIIERLKAIQWRLCNRSVSLRTWSCDRSSVCTSLSAYIIVLKSCCEQLRTFPRFMSFKFRQTFNEAFNWLSIKNFYSNMNNFYVFVRSFVRSFLFLTPAMANGSQHQKTLQLSIFRHPTQPDEGEKWGGE